MSRAIVLSSTKILSVVGVTFILGFLAGKWTTGKAAVEDVRRSSDGAFSLLVSLKFQSIAHRDRFLQLAKPVCEDVVEREEKTLSYKIAISDKDETLVMFLERYTDKDEAYLKIHKSGREFLKFREELKGMQERGEVDISGESYIETDLGFV